MSSLWARRRRKYGDDPARPTLAESEFGDIYNGANLHGGRFHRGAPLRAE